MREYFDLRSRDRVNKLYTASRPDIVIHLAASCGGIGANQSNPGSFLYNNLTMGLEMMDGAREYGVEKYVQIGTVCSYPRFTPVPFKEEYLWDGYPEPTNAPYGLAKKMLLVQAQAYRKQYGMNAIYLIPVNLFGPGDNFDLDSSHVIPALIRKCVEARINGADSIRVWGTGKAFREFLYVEDCAEAIVLATENYSGEEPINIGTGSETSIANLVYDIKDATGFTGTVIWDASRPDGQERRKLDTTRAEKEFGFVAKTDFKTGIKRTIDWYAKTFDIHI